jgi:hypothetical protein
LAYIEFKDELKLFARLAARRDRIGYEEFVEFEIAIRVVVERREHTVGYLVQVVARMNDQLLVELEKVLLVL